MSQRPNNSNSSDEDAARRTIIGVVGIVVVSIVSFIGMVIIAAADYDKTSASVASSIILVTAAMIIFGIGKLLRK